MRKSDRVRAVLSEDAGVTLDAEDAIAAGPRWRSRDARVGGELARRSPLLRMARDPGFVRSVSDWCAQNVDAVNAYVAERPHLRAFFEGRTVTAEELAGAFLEEVAGYEALPLGEGGRRERAEQLARGALGTLGDAKVWEGFLDAIGAASVEHEVLRRSLERSAGRRPRETRADALAAELKELEGRRGAGAEARRAELEGELAEERNRAKRRGAERTGRENLRLAAEAAYDAEAARAGEWYGLKRHPKDEAREVIEQAVAAGKMPLEAADVLTRHVDAKYAPPQPTRAVHLQAPGAGGPRVRGRRRRGRDGRGGGAPEPGPRGREPRGRPQA